jgi:polyhydroxybutyrate depolymerase
MPGASSSGGTCSLGATNGLVHVETNGPSPGGTTTRSYELFVPPRLNETGPVPLLLSLHGLGGTGKIQNGATHWSDFATEQAAAGAPFVLALPSGIEALWAWGAEDSYDVRFLFGLIATLEASGCIDRSQVFIDGWSAGAYMAQRMACATGDPQVPGSDVGLDAIAAYAGGSPEAAHASCGVDGKPAAPVRVLMSQGLADQVVDPKAKGFAGFSAWADRYLCEPPAFPLDQAQQLQGCRDGAAVAWWPIEGQGHIVWSCPSQPEWHNRGIWDFLTKQLPPTDTTCA